MAEETCEVVNVKVRYIRPEKQNLKAWCADGNNVYIGRAGIVFVPMDDGSKQRYPKKPSIWHNPFRVGKKYTREQAIAKYREYIVEKTKAQPELYDLKTLKGKKLGCWCHPDPCHGDVLRELVGKIAIPPY